MQALARTCPFVLAPRLEEGADVEWGIQDLRVDNQSSRVVVVPGYVENQTSIHTAEEDASPWPSLRMGALKSMMVYVEGSQAIGSPG